MCIYIFCILMKRVNSIRRYDYRMIQVFTCWNQLLAMMFGQLSNRESLRDLIVAFKKTNFNDVKDQFNPFILGLFD